MPRGRTSLYVRTSALRTAHENEHEHETEIEKQESSDARGLAPACSPSSEGQNRTRKHEIF